MLNQDRECLKQTDKHRNKADAHTATYDFGAILQSLNEIECFIQLSVKVLDESKT
jgi:hypothetical protein